MIFWWVQTMSRQRTDVELFQQQAATMTRVSVSLIQWSKQKKQQASFPCRPRLKPDITYRRFFRFFKGVLSDPYHDEKRGKKMKKG